MENTTITIEEIKSFNHKIDALSTSIELKDQEIKDLSKKIEIEQNSIKKLEKSVELEKKLRKMPCQAYGSVTFYNLMNEKFVLFEPEQFNKITRFVELIEKTEAKYRAHYLKSVEQYTKNVTDSCFSDCEKVDKNLQNMYSIIAILTNEVDKDKVKFNKAYNLLEDKGLFLTANEKNLNQMLVNMTGVLHELKDELRSIRSNVAESNMLLNEISGGIDYSNSLLFDVSSDTKELKDINTSIQTNNLISSVQSVQLHKINKNTKPKKG